MLAKCKAIFQDICPVGRNELKKFIPMFVIFFLIGFIYNILRNAKDALIITGQDSGAEIIPFIKVWVMLPGAILMTSLFSRLSNRFSMEKVFYIILSIFLSYFMIFTFCLYPFRDAMHLHAFGDILSEILPRGLSGFVAMIRYWSFTGFYVMSELWSCIVLSMLFWGFANEINTVDEAKRFYGLLGVGMNCSGVIAGQVAIFCSGHFRSGSNATDAWQASLTSLTIVIVISGLIIMGIFRWLHLNGFDNSEKSFQGGRYKQKDRGSFKMSVRRNFAYLAKSKYLIYIAVIVLSYNLVINLVEVLWKHQIRQLYPDANDYHIYINTITTWTGIVAIILALVAGAFIKRCGWTFSALICPVILLITSVGFFSCLFFSDALDSVLRPLLGISPLALVVLFGSTQNVLSRGCKYSLFDATKELSFIPLSTESRQKGKAAIDGVGSRIGKSGGSLIHQGLLMIFSGLAASAPFVAGFLMIVIVGWIAAARLLGKEFNTLVAHNETLNIDENKVVESSNKKASDPQVV